jgi:hypothetical protein
MAGWRVIEKVRSLFEHPSYIDVMVRFINGKHTTLVRDV